jgi:uncharacterized protein (TIGR02246 family)
MTTGAEQEIRLHYDRYVAAIRAQDVGAMMALYADDAHVFDTMSDWAYVGADAWRVNVEDWFSHEGMSQDVQIENMVITVAGDLAVVRMDVHFSASTETETHSMWNRFTSALRKVDGAWKIFQEHTSVPINPETMTPILERPARGN